MAVFFDAWLDFINRHSFNSSNRFCKTRPEQGADKSAGKA